MTKTIDEIRTGKFVRKPVEAAAAKPEKALSVGLLGIVLVPDVLERTPPFIDGLITGSPAAQAGLQENMACALCYLLGILTGVLFLVLEPYNKNRNVRFHAFQSIFVWIAMVVAGIVFGIVATIIAFIPFIGWTVSVLLWPLYGLATLGLWIMLMYKAYNNQRWVLPIIGPLAEKQA